MAIALKSEHLQRYRQILRLLLRYGRSDALRSAVRNSRFGGVLGAPALVFALAVPGCDPGSDRAPRQEQPASAPADTSHYFARGNEPFWAVQVTPAAIVFLEPDRPDGVRGPYAPPTRERGTLVFRTTLGDSAATMLELVLEEKPCSDGMSDQAYHLAAVARVGERVLHGCAERRSPSAPQSAPPVAREQGELQELPGKLESGQTVTVRGTIASGAECPMLLIRGERRVSLGGNLGRFRVGDHVCVHGTVAEMSICMEGEANIAIISIAPRDSCPR